MSIFYFSPLNNNRPSWGVGIIHYHVWLLNQLGFSAYIIYENKSDYLSWLNIKVPILTIREFKLLKLNSCDILVLPEVCADKHEFLDFKCRKYIFIQNVFYIYEGLKSGTSYEKLGIEGLIYYMPHIKSVLQNISDLPIYEIPPFVADYFFEDNLQIERKKKILIYPKFDSNEFYILKRILKDKLGISAKSKFERLFSNSEWSIEEISGLSHYQVSNVMKSSMYFISMNKTEAFNSAVPEAMAAGCINICYDGYGPLDYLEDNTNAFVFKNNNIYELSQKVIDLVTNYNRYKLNISEIRENAYLTAKRYNVENAKYAILELFNRLKA